MGANPRGGPRRFSGEEHRKLQEDRQKLLDEYELTSHAFSESVSRLQNHGTNTETFIRALGETGTAHRACERARIRLRNHLRNIVISRERPDRA